jgi:hypothetical protein
VSQHRWAFGDGLMTDADAEATAATLELPTGGPRKVTTCNRKERAWYVYPYVGVCLVNLSGVCLGVPSP